MYSVKEYLTMFSKTVAERTQPGQRQSIEEQGKFLHVYARSEGVAGVLVADEDYPKMTAHAVLSKVLDEFVTQNPRSSWQSGRPVAWEKQLQKAVEENRDPNAAGGIGQIQRELDETKVVLHKTIENVLERGESDIVLDCLDWTDIIVQVRRLTILLPNRPISTTARRSFTQLPSRRTAVV